MSLDSFKLFVVDLLQLEALLKGLNELRFILDSDVFERVVIQMPIEVVILQESMQLVAIRLRRGGRV